MTYYSLVHCSCSHMANMALGRMCLSNSFCICRWAFTDAAIFADDKVQEVVRSMCSDPEALQLFESLWSADCEDDVQTVLMQVIQLATEKAGEAFFLTIDTHSKSPLLSLSLWLLFHVRVNRLFVHILTAGESYENARYIDLIVRFIVHIEDPLSESRLQHCQFCT